MSQNNRTPISEVGLDQNHIKTSSEVGSSDVSSSDVSSSLATNIANNTLPFNDDITSIDP